VFNPACALISRKCVAEAASAADDGTDWKGTAATWPGMVWEERTDGRTDATKHMNLRKERESIGACRI